MIKPLISAALLGVCAVSWAADDSHAIEGVWETKTGGYVQIYQDGDTWNGRVVGSSDGVARYDENNPDESKRDRRLLGVTVLRDLKYAGDQTWEDGSIYSPDNGKTYSANISLQPDGKLRLRGFVGTPMFGKTQIWTRVN